MKNDVTLQIGPKRGMFLVENGCLPWCEDIINMFGNIGVSLISSLLTDL